MEGLRGRRAKAASVFGIQNLQDEGREGGNPVAGLEYPIMGYSGWEKEKDYEKEKEGRPRAGSGAVAEGDALVEDAVGGVGGRTEDVDLLAGDGERAASRQTRGEGGSFSRRPTQVASVESTVIAPEAWCST